MFIGEMHDIWWIDKLSAQLKDILYYCFLTDNDIKADWEELMTCSWIALFVLNQCSMCILMPQFLPGCVSKACQWCTNIRRRNAARCWWQPAAELEEDYNTHSCNFLVCSTGVHWGGKKVLRGFHSRKLSEPSIFVFLSYIKRVLLLSS